MKEYFERISFFVSSIVDSSCGFNINFSAEQTKYARFNQGLFRQQGHIDQFYLTLDLFREQKRLQATVGLSWEWPSDQRVLRDIVQELEAKIDIAPIDLFFSSSTPSEGSEVGPSHHQLFDKRNIMSDIIEASRGQDLVGIFMGGGIYRGFSSSSGQFSWYSTSNLNFDWSLYSQGDKAVKQRYSAEDWNSNDFRRIIERGIAEKEILNRKSVSVEPGKHRVYIAPMAMEEILWILSDTSFGVKNLKVEASALGKLHKRLAELSPKITIVENNSRRASPQFDDQGIQKPEKITLVKEGKAKDLLVSSRSALEYGLTSNAANKLEMPESLELLPGTLETKDILNQLGDGIVINNLWYLNYSDLREGRLTGMTRFACFLVKNSEIIAPINVMRFDDSIYSMLGSKLEDLSADRQLLLDCSSYEQRSTDSRLLPGALISELNLV